MEISKLWFDDDKIFVRTKDGCELWQSLLWYRRLRYASDTQRNSYRMSYSGIHWPDIDEDISFESFLYDNPEPTGISRLFMQFPELNASAIARRTGMQQSLLAAYIRGTKKPSGEQAKKIQDAVHEFAGELMQADFLQPLLPPST
ncbi:MAG: DUF2442 domain-containing protein [Tannerella sp.]|jgi:transcriptional regulator with XRE-family HTH domain|nr:DUF2442 domain-containing protein [Tannerella sp.]